MEIPVKANCDRRCTRTPVRRTEETVKSIIGLVIGFAIGGACRAFGVPLPAPPVLVGACLVVAMTAGYSLTDRYLVQKESTTKELCGGPTGTTASGT